MFLALTAAAEHDFLGVMLSCPVLSLMLLAGVSHLACHVLQSAMRCTSNSQLHAADRHGILTVTTKAWTT